MREYGKVSPAFWTGETGRRLRAAGPDSVILALYLMTAPTASWTGLYYLPLSTLAHETGMTIEGALEALRRVEATGFAVYDREEEHVWVPQMARFQIVDHLKPSDNRVKGVVKDLMKCRKSRFFRCFCDIYLERFSLRDALHEAGIEATSEGLGRGFEGASKPLRSPEPKPEPEPEPTPTAPRRGERATVDDGASGSTVGGDRVPYDGGTPLLGWPPADQGRQAGAARPPPDTRRPQLSEAYSPGFEAFWDALPGYVHKKGKEETYKHWTKNRLEPQSGLIVRTVERDKRSPQWRKEGGRFIPKPLNYLRDTPWLTDPSELVAAPAGPAIALPRGSNVQRNHC